jgi:hypothetical protein
MADRCLSTGVLGKQHEKLLVALDTAQKTGSVQGNVRKGDST